MKFIIALISIGMLASAQDPVTSNGLEETQQPTPMTRDLPADVLRDFVGLCFASTLCRVFEVGQKWELSPFCGTANCILSPDGFLIERVQDCGILPKPNPSCKIVNEDARNETYPACCPVFQCEKGIKLEYPTKEELQASLISKPGASATKQ